MYPPSNFSWVIPDQLAASAFPYNKGEFDFLQHQGINALVNLTFNSDYPPSLNIDQKFTVHRIKIPDFSIPSKEQVDEFIKIVDNHIDSGEKVLVHCMAGCGRTGTMLAIWLGVHNSDKPIEDTIRDLRKLRPCSVEIRHQYEFVVNYVESYRSNLRQG